LQYTCWQEPPSKLSSRQGKGTDKRARQVNSEYTAKAQHCDEQFVQEAQGDSGPFERALCTFLKGGPIPLIFGAFGETNKAFLTYLSTAALAAASTEEGLAMSPVKYVHDKNGAYNLILHKFRQVAVVAIARSLAQLRLQHLHYIRPSKQAAALAAKRHMTGQTWSSHGASSWFACNERHQYEEWHKFCNLF